MHLDHRHGDALDRIMNGNRRVGERPCVQQHCQRTARTGFVQPIDDMAFVVGLADIEREAQRRRLRFQPLGNIVQRVMALDMRFAAAQQVQVGAVQHHHEWLVGHHPSKP